ncbi:hypothetical protein BRD56_11590 [Thermoplasmatales archaeon SW_10_69_26]|nr:MAG: hypothetical protein BRD56_11590 [Thermoplasmatales archaeon SW_10_69_26]
MHVKDEVRLIGFDEGPFTFEDTTCPLAGVMTRGGGYLEAVLVDEITVDGTDVDDTVIELLADSSLLETAQAIAFQGGTLAGFNVLDLARLHQTLGLPVLALTEDEPDPPAVRQALRDTVRDPDRRIELLEAQPVHPVSLDEGTIHMRHVGGDHDQLAELVRAHTVRGLRPEPVRIAGLVARALARGSSTGTQPPTEPD